MPWPKHASRAVAFTKDGMFAAIATRRDCKDYINMLACRGWEAMGTFGADTVDLADLEWSPTDSTIAVWDSPLEYKVLSAISICCLFSCPRFRHHVVSLNFSIALNHVNNLLLSPCIYLAISACEAWSCAAPSFCSS